MYSKITALIRSNGSHFLTAGFFVEETYKVKKINGALGYYRIVMLKVTMYSMMRLLFIQRVLF